MKKQTANWVFGLCALYSGCIRLGLPAPEAAEPWLGPKFPDGVKPPPGFRPQPGWSPKKPPGEGGSDTNATPFKNVGGEKKDNAETCSAEVCT